MYWRPPSRLESDLRFEKSPTKQHYKIKYQLRGAFLVFKDPFKLKSAKVWNKTPAGSRNIHRYIKHFFQEQIKQLQVAAHSESGSSNMNEIWLFN